MSHKCHYCEKTFNSKAYLKIHQKKAKYCLKLQEKNNFCQYCQSSVVTLESHYTNCIEYYKKLVKDNLIEIKALKRKILTLEGKKENSNSNTKTFDVFLEQINNVINAQFKEEYLILGQKGIAKFVYEHIIKNTENDFLYICIDESKQIFNFKNTENETEKDYKAKKLTQLIVNSDLKKIAHQISCNKMSENNPESFMEFTDHFREIQKLEYNNVEFRRELIELLKI
jgi:hypothetical protein